MRGWNPYTAPIDSGLHEQHYSERNLMHIHLEAGAGLLGKELLRVAAVRHICRPALAAEAEGPAHAADAEDRRLEQHHL